MIFHFEYEQRSSAWYEARLGTVTASEMDKIITPGGKPSRSCAAYMNRLLAEWVLGVPVVVEYESEFMIHGRENEAGAVKAFEFQTGLDTQEVGFITTDDGLLGCSPDRLVMGDSGTLEIKCPSAPVHISYLLQESVADEYCVQVQSQLMICEREKSWVCSFHPKLPAVILEIPRDEEFIDKISKATGTFIDVMLEKRSELERRFGPFVRKGDIPRKPPQRTDEYEAMFALN